MQSNLPTSAEGPICLWSLRFVGILQQAGFQVDELQATSQSLDTTFDFYSTTEAGPRDGQLASELESLNRLADELSQALKQMSGRARLSLAYEAYNLAAPLMAFSVRTKLTQRDVPPDKGGAEKQTTKLRLILNLAIEWRMAFPTGKPVRRSSAGDYSGPLLDFVEKVLKFEGIRVQSTNELGKQLYEMRTVDVRGDVGPPCSLIDEKARHSRSRTATSPVTRDPSQTG